MTDPSQSTLEPEHDAHPSDLLVTISGRIGHLPPGGDLQHERDELCVLEYDADACQHHAWGLSLVLDGEHYHIHERNLDLVRTKRNPDQEGST